jgi:O-antigen ligase
MRSIFIHKTEILSLYLFAFLIPLNPKWYGFGLIAIALETIWKFKVYDRISKEKFKLLKSPLFFLFVFFMLHFIGLIYTSNMDFALSDIGMKSTFVLLPLYFYFLRPRLDLTRMFQYFVIGCVFSVVFFGAFSLAHFIEGGTLNIGVKFSLWMHRSYYATYLILAFNMVLIRRIEKNKISALNLVVLLLLICGVLITESKMSIIILLLSLLSLVIYYLKKNFGWIKVSLSLLILSVLTFFLINSVLTGNNRFSGAFNNLKDEKLDVSSTESTTARVFMWETSLELILENPLLGVGTGDIKDALRNRNYQKGYVGVADADFNSHNQFFNSWLALGILGLFSLLAVFVLLVLNAEKDKSLIVLYISGSLFLTFLTESFLETQAGIIPFAFLISALSLNQKSS